MSTAAASGGQAPTGLPYRPQLPWGTHLCHFFHTADDLLSTLVPFVAAGLADREQCLWVAGDPISPAAARDALRAEVSDIDAREQAGDIEIVGYGDWYFDEASLDTEAVVERWLAREAAAVRHGFRGLRLTGNVGRLEGDDWTRFRQYEARVHDAFRRRRIIALCSYSLDQIDTGGVVDVIRNHGFAVIRRNGVWETTAAATCILPELTASRRPRAASTPQPVDDREGVHSLQLLPDTSYPAEEIARFLAEALQAGETALAVATAGHLTALETAFVAAGVDVAAALHSEALLLLDADQTLGSLLADGHPDESRFNTVIGSALARATTKCRPVRLYGEMVDVLRRQGNLEAALALERMWMRLLAEAPARLPCSSSISNFDGAQGIDRRRGVCAHPDSAPGDRSGQAAADRHQLIAELHVHEHVSVTEAARRRDAEHARQRTLAELQDAHERLHGLQVITAALAQALTLDQVGRVVTGEIARRVGAIRSILAVPGAGEVLTLLAHDGLAGDAHLRYSSFPLTSNIPVAEAYRTASPVWLPSRADFACRFPDLAQTSPSRAAACVPVTFDGRVLGVLGFGFDAERTFEPVDQALLHDFATQVGGALERARLHEAVRASEARLAEMNRRKDDFMAVLGHELRNPLAPMLTALQVMKLRGDRTGERERAVIERQITYVGRLVDDLLDVSRITRGKLDLRRSVVEIGSVMAHAVELSAPIVEQRGHCLVVDIPEENVRIEADAMRLAQALGNLLTNAAKYTDAGGLITVRVARDGNWLSIVVKDDGIGIPAEMLSDIFEPFVQVERTMERSQGGLGLGLTLVRTLVELHGGTVSAASAGPGRGSEFHVRLPTLSGARDASPAAPAADDRKDGTSGRRVLVVDDNLDGADSLAEVLRLLGHDADVAYDGSGAVHKAVAGPFDFVLLDINLPGMDGYEVARRIRERAPDRTPRFVAMTGFGTEDDHSRSREEGFIAHLVKPVDYQRLTDLLQST